MVCYTDATAHVYDFGYGMNWKGIIKDARTSKYINIPEPVISEKENLVTITNLSQTKVYYSIDNSSPAFIENHLYSKPFTVKAGRVVKAIAKKYGIGNSSMATLTIQGNSNNAPTK